LGNPKLRLWIKQVALGSLLHMVEDSFAKGHAERAVNGESCAAAGSSLGAGRIREFHSYVNQDSK
jgi:hypothetical protein